MRRGNIRNNKLGLECVLSALPLCSVGQREEDRQCPGRGSGWRQAFIHSTSNYLLSTFSLPGIMLDAGNECLSHL